MRNVVCTSDAPNVIGRDSCQETERALQNIAAILKEAGSNLDKVLRCGVFLKNMNDFGAMNDGKIFGPHPPARTTVEAAPLPKDSLLQTLTVTRKKILLANLKVRRQQLESTVYREDQWQRRSKHTETES